MYKRNCAKSRKKLGGVYLLGGSHRSVGADACIRPRGCTSLPDCTGGYGIRPYGHVEVGAAAQGPPLTAWRRSSPQGEPYGARHLEAPLEGSWRRRRLRGGPVAVIYGITKNRPARLGAGR